MAFLRPLSRAATVVDDDAVTAAAVVVGALDSSPPLRVARNPHTPTTKGFSEMLRWPWERAKGESGTRYSDRSMAIRQWSLGPHSSRPFNARTVP